MIDKELLAYIKGKRKYLFLISLFSVLGLASSVSMTYCFCLAMEKFLVGDNFGFWLLLIGFGLALLFGAFFLMKSHLSNSLSEYVATKIRRDVFNKYLDMEGNCALSPQQIAQLSSEGVEQLRLYYSNYLPSFFYAMIAPISLFILFLFISWPVAILYLACVPLIPMSIIMVSKWAKKIFATYWNRYLSLGGAYLDAVSGMKELLIFHYDPIMQEKMKENSEEFRKITMKVLVMQLFSTTIMDIVAYGGAAVGIVLTLVYLNQGDINWTLALFMCLVGAEFFLPMRALGSAFHVAMNGATAGKKVLTLLKEEPLPIGERKISSIDQIKIKGLSYKYEEAHKNVLEGIDMELGKGFYCLVGESGSGKSTLGSILIKKLYGYQGSVSLGGIEVKDADSTSYFSHLSYVSSSSYLLSKSIRDSFRFYNPEVNEETMYSLLDQVNLKERIMHSGGLDYVPKEGASDLSGGEKQRLLLAYNLANPKDFELFDEATSSIDKESEAIIVKKIKEISKDKTILFITHRLQNAEGAKNIYVLSKGKIIQQGEFGILKRADGYFKDALKKEIAKEEVAI